MTFLSVIIHFRLLKIQLVTSNDVPEDGYAYRILGVPPPFLHVKKEAKKKLDISII